MTLDLCYVAKNRLVFTQQTMWRLRKNTNWSKVRKFIVYDDGSTDGTREYLQDVIQEYDCELRLTNFNSGILVQNDFISRSGADLVAKFDNDSMLPPGWLDAAVGVMERHPELELLGLECHGHSNPLPYRYEPAEVLDGLFVARGNLFSGRPLPVATSPYDGWGQWVKDNKVRAGWLAPSIDLFLLDRVPVEPWQTLSRKYEALGWQRPWKQYDPARAGIWKWCGWA
jgi:glycosyltransferase involved in cell wall biosynthesis